MPLRPSKKELAKASAFRQGLSYAGAHGVPEGSAKQGRATRAFNLGLESAEEAKELVSALLAGGAVSEEFGKVSATQEKGLLSGSFLSGASLGGERSCCTAFTCQPRRVLDSQHRFFEDYRFGSHPIRLQPRGTGLGPHSPDG